MAAHLGIELDPHGFGPGAASARERASRPGSPRAAGSRGGRHSQSNSPSSGSYFAGADVTHPDDAAGAGAGERSVAGSSVVSGQYEAPGNYRRSDGRSARLAGAAAAASLMAGTQPRVSSQNATMRSAEASAARAVAAARGTAALPPPGQAGHDAAAEDAGRLGLLHGRIAHERHTQGSFARAGGSGSPSHRAVSQLGLRSRAAAQAMGKHPQGGLQSGAEQSEEGKGRKTFVLRSAPGTTAVSTSDPSGA